MPDVRVEIHLPYLLRVPDGEYPAGIDGPVWLARTVNAAGMPATLAWGVFEAPAAPAPDEAERVKARQAARLLRATNRLIRWYRAVAREAEAAEVTRAQASPFRFNLVAGYAPWGSDPELRFEVTFLHVPATRSGDEIRRAVREGLGSGEDPPVADLLLLDAERFREAGRFREAVLFCWSTIDATFNRKYEQLVEARLAGEWGDAVNFFTGVTFGMRNKMTAALFLLANTSLFRVLGEAGWERLSNSYRKRNGIIHRGEPATEDDADSALAVAREVVGIVNALPLA